MFDEDSAGLRPDLEAETGRRLWSIHTQVLVFIYLRQCGADEETGAESDASFNNSEMLQSLEASVHHRHRFTQSAAEAQAENYLCFFCALETFVVKGLR